MKILIPCMVLKTSGNIALNKGVNYCAKKAGIYDKSGQSRISINMSCYEIMQGLILLCTIRLIMQRRGSVVIREVCVGQLQTLFPA